MYQVNRNNLTRTAKRSAWFYADLIREHGFKSAFGQCPYRENRERVLYNQFPAGKFIMETTNQFFILDGIQINLKKLFVPFMIFLKNEPIFSSLLRACCY